MARIQPVKLPRNLPVVLSPQEVSRLIAAASNVKHQAAFSIVYGAGLRANRYPDTHEHGASGWIEHAHG